MLKKYLYISILLGAFALSGCSGDETDNKEVTGESSPTEQSIAINNQANTTEKEEIAPIPLNLTQEQKEDYYQEYIAIIEKINVENGEDFQLELESLTAFLDEYWIKVEDFEKLAKERADTSIVVLENIESYSPMSAPKTVKLQIGSNEANIIFDASFDTKYNPNVPGGGQLFSTFNGITSEAENANGSWIQIGYNASLMDNKSTYVIDVSGKHSQSGIISTHTMSLKFNCDKYGGIS